MSSIIEEAIEIIGRNPGIGSGALASELGIPPCNARRAAKAGVATGFVTITGNQVTGFRYWPANGSPGHVLSAPVQRHDDQPIDVPFRVVSEPATGRALVLSGQPYDSRTEAALRQLAVIKARAGRSPKGQMLTGQDVANLNALFAADDGGAGVLTSFQQAAEARLKAQTAHEQWVREQYARQEQERREAEAKEKEKADKADMLAVMQSMLGMGSAPKADRRGPREEGVIDEDEGRLSFAEEARRAREQRRLEGEERNEMLYQEGVKKERKLWAELGMKCPEEDEPYFRVDPAEWDREHELLTRSTTGTNSISNTGAQPAATDGASLGSRTAKPGEREQSAGAPKGVSRGGLQRGREASGGSWREWLWARFATPRRAVWK